LGRRTTILLGISGILSAFFLASFLTKWNFLAFVGLFVLAGFGWALINVNSYPMVVEYSNGSNGGKFTGFYYTASQLAQTITPFIIGSVMDKIGRRFLFPYATFFLLISLVCIILTKENKSSTSK
jgi:MFS family permease